MSQSHNEEQQYPILPYSTYVFDASISKLVKSGSYK